MEVNIKEVDSIPILIIIGEVSLYDIELISSAISEVRDSGKNSIIVNLREVPFMDSSGIGVFMQTIVSISKDNGVLYFTNCNKRIKNLLNFSLENTTSKIFNTEEEAVAALKKKVLNT